MVASPVLDSHQRLEWALNRCKEQGLRRTHALLCALRAFAESPGPVSAAALLTSPLIAGVFNRVTLYRILARLESLGVLRKIGLNERSQHYVMPLPGEHHDYLVCSRCGHLESSPLDCPLEDLNDRITRKTGFRVDRHDLVFWGRCVNCVE